MGVCVLEFVDLVPRLLVNMNPVQRHKNINHGYQIAGFGFQ